MRVTNRRMASVTAFDRFHPLDFATASNRSNRASGTLAAIVIVGPSGFATLRPAPGRFPPRWDFFAILSPPETIIGNHIDAPSLNKYNTINGGKQGQKKTPSQPGKVAAGQTIRLVAELLRYLKYSDQPQKMGAVAVISFNCEHEHTKRHGKDRKGNQRLRCLHCGRTWTERGPKPLGDMRISTRQAALALGMLLEGMAIRAVQRLTGLDRNTLCDMILVVGENCQRLLDATIKSVPVEDVQVDELWSFVGMKEKIRVARGYSAEYGDSWTFLGIERNTKLILAHQVGLRDQSTCCEFLARLNRATTGRFQLSTDGLKTYTTNVPFVLGSRVDFAQLVKTYQSTQEVTRYSPAAIISAEKKPQFGDPDWYRISTSHIERFNLTVRMSMRRFTRLTNAHSKSHKHHVAMQAVFVAWYNFCRKHETLNGHTPAMAAGLVDKIWTIRELLESAAAV